MNSGFRGKGGMYHPKDRQYGFRKNPKRWIVLFLLAAVLAVAGAVVWIIQGNQELTRVQIAADNLVNVGSGYRNITYKGKDYRYNNRIKTILYAGLDSDTPLVEYAKYTIAPRADSISLVVLDELHKKMTVISLSRDTMTLIRKYSLDGKNMGLFKDHLNQSYTYGNGGKKSCENLCEAVSMLLYNIPINDYVISNRASMEIISGIIGPVEVTVPNNDLIEQDELFVEGAQVSIDSSNLELFVRYRDTDKNFSNTGRMERQQAYITGAMMQVRKLMNDQPNEFWKMLQKAEEFVQTSVTRNRYLELARIMKDTTFTSHDYYIPDGEQVVGKHYDEFYPDEEKMLEKVVDLFYIQ